MMQLQEKKPKEKCENLGEERGEMNSGCKKSGRKKATPKTPGLILLASPMYFHLTDFLSCSYCILFWSVFRQLNQNI
jgi:hypothetical protein